MKRTASQYRRRASPRRELGFKCVTIACVLGVAIGLAMGFGVRAGTVDSSAGLQGLQENSQDDGGAQQPPPGSGTLGLQDPTLGVTNRLDSAVSGKAPNEKMEFGTTAFPANPLRLPDQSRGSSPGVNGPQPLKGTTLEELGRDFTKSAVEGLVKPLAGAPSAADEDLRRRPADRGPPQTQTPSPLSDLHKMVNELTKVDTINGLGEPVGLNNKAISEIRGIISGKEGQSDVVGEPVGAGADPYGSQPDQRSAIDAIDEPPASLNRRSPPPAWLTAVLEATNTISGFAHENRVLLVVLGVLALGMTAVFQRNR